MSSLLQDLRFAFRQLRRSPVFSLAMIATLALSVGATSALSGVLRATLLNRLPYPQPDQLVSVRDRNLQGFKTNGIMTMARVGDLTTMTHDGHPLFTSVGFFYGSDGQLVLEGRDPRRVSGVGVSGDFFRTISATPLLGRTITTADDVRNAPYVAVISHALWQSAFSADPKVLGRMVRLGTDQATIIGVMPARFDLPGGTEIWYPGRVSQAQFQGYRGDGSRFLNVIARLHPAETITTAAQQTALLATQLARAYPATDAIWAFDLLDLRTSLFGAVRRGLLLLSASVGLVLLVVTANLAGLQLSRHAMRRPEFAIRGALGVSPGRLTRQLLTETLVLVMSGSLLGISLGALGLRLLTLRLPAVLLSVDTPHLDTTVLVISCATALLIGVLSSLLPALQSTRFSARASSQRIFGGPTRRIGGLFTVAQIALSLVLLTLSAAVLRELYGLLNTPLGFETENLQTCSVDVGWNLKDEDRHRLYQQTETAIAALPGVSAVGAISALPLADFSVRSTFDIAGAPLTQHHDSVVAEGRSFSPGYLHAMQIPLLAGRTFTDRDSAPNAPTVSIINQAFATRYFAGKNAVGQRLVLALGVKQDVLGSTEIIGVIGNVRGTGGPLSQPPGPEIYGPENGGWPHPQFAIRSTLPQTALEPAIRRIVLGLNGSATVGRFTPLATTLNASLTQPRLNAGLLTAFAALSLLLVVIGVYGLVAFDITQRTRELGLRMALGSSRNGTLRTVLGDSIRSLAIGLGFGLAGSTVAAKAVAAEFYGVTAATPTLLLPIVLLLSLAVLSAALVPARRAANIDPIQALRSE